MSVYVIPEHQASYFTCDFIGGKPEHRSAAGPELTKPAHCRSATAPPGSGTASTTSTVERGPIGV